MDLRSSVMAIVVCGSPAPGVNSVISAVVIEAINSGIEVLGIKHGFKYIKMGIVSAQTIKPLCIDDVSSLYAQPGSILFTSKAQLDTSQDVDNVIRAFQHLRVRYLVSIGGVETAHSVRLLSEAATDPLAPISFVHVPKTIYNDLPLPQECVTFGFTTARDVGVSLCSNFRVDAKTLGRWYIITVMGQRAGHLSEGIGKGSAATVTIIPEEFESSKVTFKELADIVEASMIKRLAMDRDYGIVVLTEGLVTMLPREEIVSLFGDVSRGYENLARVMSEEIYRRLTRKNIVLTVLARIIGSELRSAPPNSADINLARDLGYSATRYLLSGKSGGMVGLRGGSTIVTSLDEIRKESGEFCVRSVDLTSGAHEVSQKYQIRLKKTDLQDVDLMKKMCDLCKMTSVEFINAFESSAC